MNKPGFNSEPKSHFHSNNYNNEIGSGNVGSEDGHDNGASTLRALRKKRAEAASVNRTRKPIL